MTSSADDPYVVLRGDSVMMSGSIKNLASARAESRALGGASLVWFRHEGRAYVARSAALLVAIERVAERREPFDREHSEQGRVLAGIERRLHELLVEAVARGGAEPARH